MFNWFACLCCLFALTLVSSFAPASVDAGTRSYFRSSARGHRGGVRHRFASYRSSMRCVGGACGR